jgi:hypothetical protein
MVITIISTRLKMPMRMSVFLSMIFCYVLKTWIKFEGLSDHVRPNKKSRTHSFSEIGSTFSGPGVGLYVKYEPYSPLDVNIVINKAMLIFAY